MTIEIQSDGKYYMIKNVNWVKQHDGELIVNYKDDNNEPHEESGAIPEYFRVMDCD